MKFCRAWLTCCLALWTIQETAKANPEDSVVKIYSSARFPNPVQPWARGQAVQNVGSGVIIEGKRILTNAHIVAYGADISVEDRKAGEKYDAKVAYLDSGVDMAILSIDDDKFFDKRTVLAREPQLPRLQDRVAIFGFPIGGAGMSITKGEVSRIEYGPFGRGIGPVIQVSAAINPGNSGGPAVVDGKMIGLVVSRVQNAQNIGTIIANEEIDIFLKNAKQGDRKAQLASHFSFQRLESQPLRRKFKVDAAVRGVLLHGFTAGRDTPLEPFDVLTKVGDYSVDNTGLVQLKDGMRVPFYLVPRLARDQALPVTIWRQGREIETSLPVTTHDNRLVRPYQGEALSYFIHGPLVFAQGKSDDVSLYAQMNRSFYLDNSPLVTRADETVRFPGEELVVVSALMFAHRVSKGYGDPVGRTIKDVNGVAIKNLRHLVETIRDSTDEFLTFHFIDNFSEVLVFDRKDAIKATEEILEDNGIPVGRRGSADMLKIWNATPDNK